MICQTVANSVPRKRGGRAVAIKDFMPYFGPPDKWALQDKVRSVFEGFMKSGEKK